MPICASTCTCSGTVRPSSAIGTGSGRAPQTFVTDPQTYEEIQQSPYVLAGQGPWAPEFEAAVRRTLEEAAGTGG